MYGYRARIGYTSPPMLTEVFPYEFYRIVPEGVTLVLTTLSIRAITSSEVDESWEISLRAAREMAKAKVSVIVLGGGPINLSRGFDVMEETVRGIEAECGVPVTTSVKAQHHALERLGARSVGVVIPTIYGVRAGESIRELNEGLLKHHGYHVTGFTDTANSVEQPGGLAPLDLAPQLARELVQAHPEIDTLLLPSPHWPVAGSVEAIEQELGVNVVSALQAIVWEALRLAGIDDRIPGFGRLLRDF